MKKTVIIISILLTSVFCFSQKDTSAIKAKDSLTADTKFISVNDIWRFADKYYRSSVASDYDAFRSIIAAILQDAIAEWNQKYPAKKPK